MTTNSWNMCAYTSDCNGDVHTWSTLYICLFLKTNIDKHLNVWANQRSQMVSYKETNIFWQSILYFFNKKKIITTFRLIFLSHKNRTPIAHFMTVIVPHQYPYIISPTFMKLSTPFMLQAFPLFLNPNFNQTSTLWATQMLLES